MKKLIVTVASMAFFCFMISGTVSAQSETATKKSNKTEATSSTKADSHAGHGCTHGTAGADHKSCCATKGGASASGHEGCTKGKGKSAECSKKGASADSHKCEPGCTKSCCASKEKAKE